MKCKVLIASEDKNSNLLLSDQLCNSFEVHIVTDGKSASDFLVKNGHVDILICDYLTPSLNGIELAKRIKASYSTGSMKILMVASTLNPSLYVEMINSGVDAIVEKPFDLTNMESRLWKILPEISQS